MVKSELIKIIIKYHPYLSAEKAEKAINVFFEQITQALISNNTVELRGLGCFSCKTTNKRKGRNPKTYEQLEIESKRLPFFRISNKLTKLLN